MDKPRTAVADDGITAEHLGAAIPTALLVAILTRQPTLPADPVRVDARDLEIIVPGVAVADLLRGMLPGREVAVTFDDGTITVVAAGLPAVRVEIPADGLRLFADDRGLRIGGH